MKIQESAENYLETIYILQNRHGHVRSIDIAVALDYSKPSVSRAVKLLRENNYITMAKDGAIDLTESGRKIAEKMHERHTLLSRFLIQLGVEENVAKKDACRMEHVISEETFSKLKCFIEAM